MLFASKLSILKRAPSQPHLAPDLTSGKRTQPLHRAYTSPLFWPFQEFYYFNLFLLQNPTKTGGN